MLRAPAFWDRDASAARLLGPLGIAYDLAGRLRRALGTPTRIGRPVICVGNLTLGGTGKTPVVLALAGHLEAKGRAVHAVTRGYGGRARGPLRVDPAGHQSDLVGDEALLLARRMPTWVALNRVAGARAAVAAGAEVILLDDGFQNPAVHKDRALLVIDGDYGFGNGRVFPAGPLRETVARGLRRADGVVLLGDDPTGLAGELERQVPLLRARLLPGAGAPVLAGRRVLAFAGIGRPEKFFATLEGEGAMIVERHAFSDHHPFSAGEIEQLLEAAARLEATPVTTEKDAVRLPAADRAKVTVLPVALQWEDAAKLDDLLRL